MRLTKSVHRMDFISIHMLRQIAFIPHLSEIIEKRVNEEKKGIPISTQNILDRK